MNEISLYEKLDFKNNIILDLILQNISNLEYSDHWIIGNHTHSDKIILVLNLKDSKIIKDSKIFIFEYYFSKSTKEKLSSNYFSVFEI